MSRFSDLLNRPLPSSVITESGDDLINNKQNPQKAAEEAKEKMDDLKKKMANEEVAPEVELDKDTDDKPVSDIANNADINPQDPVDAFIADDQSGEDDDDAANQRIDDTIQRVATPIIMSETMNDEELSKFFESAESDVALSEDFYTERTIVKFDKKARFAQLLKVAVLAIAKEKKDPLYKKLCIAWKMEKAIENRLSAKYAGPARQRAAQYIKKAKASKSNAIKNAAHKIK